MPTETVPTETVPTETVPTETVPKDWIDPKTGHRVVRLSELAGSVCLYFHQNAYSPQGDKLLIVTPRGFETVDLQTHELQLVVPKGNYRMGGSSGVEVGRRTRHVYYSARDEEGGLVRATHLDTGHTRDVARLPLGASFNGVNADETLLFGSMRERSRRGERRDPRAARSMQLFTANIETGEINTFHPSTDWLNHLQCSPLDPQFGLFCHEGPWHEVDRVWTIPFGSDDPKLMHRREQQYEIAGHEFFSHDGKWVWYDLQTPRSVEFWLAGVHVETGERIQYRLERDQWSVHYNISPDGKFFAGDGGGPASVANHTALPEKKRLDPPGNGQWIYLFKPQSELESATVSGDIARSGRMVAQRLVDLSSHDYSLEPNVTFTPDGKWVVFRSNMHGERHVYAVRVDRESN
ncbi:oligogalacturonate lyase family protein [Novipirellula herctigrandis]|uniref:oligogalacturonate lyase family protein n=1 Tax=Novipirellula herctigrandis TaxID=2527986 RepID=UPI003AF39042